MTAKFTEFSRRGETPSMPRTDGMYRVRLKDGTEQSAYWIGRKEVWVTPDGAEGVIGVVEFDPKRLPDLK